MPPVQIDMTTPPVQATMPQPEIIAPVIIPAEVTAFLQAVDELTASWEELKARIENGEELDFDAEMEAVNILGLAAMDAYEAVQMADLESFDGVESALIQMVAVTADMGYAANLLLSTGHTCYLRIGKIVVDSNNIQKSYIYPKRTSFTCVNSQGHSTNANHGYSWSDIKNCYPGAIGYTRTYPGVNGKQKIPVYSLPAYGSIELQNDAMICLVFRETPTYTVTVNYVYENGQKAADSKSKTGVNGTSYSWTSPTISGYTPDKATVSGTINGNKTITVTYKSNVEKVTLTYDANGGTNPPAATTLNKGSKFTIKNKQNMTHDGDYTFLGWNEDKDATSADPKWGFGEEVVLNQNTTLYAIWKKNGPTPPNGTFDLKKVFVGLDEIPADFSFDYTVTSGTNTATEKFNIGNAKSVDEDTLTVTWKAPYYYNMGANNNVTIVEKADVEGYTYTATSSAGNANGNTITFVINAMLSGATRTITNTYTPNIVEKPELTVTKTASATKVKPGETVNYTIEVKNTGNADAKNVTVTDVLDSNLTFGSATLNGKDITLENGVYTIGDLAKNGTAKLIITATVKDNVAAGTEIKNTATADYDGKPDDENPSDTVDVTVIDNKITVRVKKVFEGIEASDIPNNFKLTWVAGKDKGELTLNNFTRKDNDLTYIWAIEMADDETLKLTESGAGIAGKSLTVSAEANKSWLNATLNSNVVTKPAPESEKTAAGNNGNNSGVVTLADGYDITDSDSDNVTVVIPAAPYVTVTNKYEGDNGKGIEISKTRKAIKW